MQRSLRITPNACLSTKVIVLPANPSERFVQLLTKNLGLWHCDVPADLRKAASPLKG